MARVVSRYAPLSTHEADIWWAHADLAHAAALRADFERAQDMARYTHHTRHARTQSLAALALLRGLLHQRWGAWWARTPLAHEPCGAPFLPYGPERAISISHSAGQIAVAASLSAAVGIDIEWMDPAFRMAPVVRRCFHPREARVLAALPSRSMLQTFYAWWVAKEAVVKCLHMGLALPTASFLIPHPLGAGPVLGLHTAVWVTALPAPAGYRMALAWRGGPKDPGGLRRIEPPVVPT
ncbi:MAG: 4'-phosphopantetheinyl transferase family protein [Ramlibacter sp.]